MKVLITGCNGFIGSSLMEYLNNLQEHEIYGVSRNKNFNIPGCTTFFLEDIKKIDELTALLDEVDVVINTIGKAHVMNTETKKDQKNYSLINSDLCLYLAKRASQSKVKKFIYLSSIKVFGDKANKEDEINELSEPAPTDPYGKSKFEAELKLLQLSKNSDMDVIIVRPPLVYGKGVKGNMALLERLLRTNIPLPLRSITNNQRSMISIKNLCHFISHCLNSDIVGGSYLVSDGTDLSTYEILTLLKKYTGSKSLLFSFPISLIRILAFLTGSTTRVSRLLQSYAIDIDYTRKKLNWEPPYKVEEGFKEMVE